VIKLKAERDILKKSRGLLREGIDVKFSFIAKHRVIWPVGWLCGALGVSRGRSIMQRANTQSAPRFRTVLLIALCGGHQRSHRNI
jgi:hypothetical protein